ncbi:MAG: fimbrial protein [Kluyvera intermedia]
MKKSLIAVALAATAVLSVSNVFADSGVVKFSGSILEDACTPTITAPNGTVDLGEHAKTDFKAANDTTSPVSFTIKLDSCPAAVTSATVMFEGDSDATNSALLAITAETGSAKGVGINMMTADKADLPLGGTNSYKYTLQPTPASNDLVFYAQYKATTATVTGGPANSSANFTVDYN